MNITAASFGLIFGLIVTPAFATEKESELLSRLNAEQQSIVATTAPNLSGQENTSAPVVYIVEQSLPDFLRQAARRNGYQIKLSPRVRGTLKRMSLPLDIKKILEQIAPQFDLKWHFQQQQVYVSVGSESTTRLIYLGNMSMQDLEKSLDGAGLSSSAYDLSFVEESNSVIVNGPVSYIASVELIAESFNKNKKERKDRIKMIRFGNVSKP